ncbi:MAG: SufD family Fe-S cluster assembly protein [Bacteroidales bacterium]
MKDTHTIYLTENEQKTLVFEGDISPILNLCLAQNSTLNLLVLHRKNVNSEHYFDLQKGSSLKAVYLALEGNDIKQTIRVNINGKNVEAATLGFITATNTDNCKFDVQINHKCAASNSTQIFKQIATQNAVVQFDGRVVVAKDAQQTNAQQTCKSLLLSKTAQVNTNPQLEIYADDVKCSHGATVGQLDANVLFYLRTRGIGMDEAKRLLLLGFAEDIIQQISDESTRERMWDLVQKRIQDLLKST